MSKLTTAERLRHYKDETNHMSAQAVFDFVEEKLAAELESQGITNGKDWILEFAQNGGQISDDMVEPKDTEDYVFWMNCLECACDHMIDVEMEDDDRYDDMWVSENMWDRLIITEEAADLRGAYKAGLSDSEIESDLIYELLADDMHEDHMNWLGENIDKLESDMGLRVPSEFQGMFLETDYISLKAAIPKLMIGKAWMGVTYRYQDHHEM